MKKAVFFLLIIIMLQGTCYSDGISVSVNGSVLKSDTPPVIIDSRTFVPLRAIFEALNANVVWDEKTKTITAKKGDVTISLSISSSNMIKNGEKIRLDSPPVLYNKRTMVPLRAVSEGFGCTVLWNENDDMVYVYDTGSAPNRFLTKILTDPEDINDYFPGKSSVFMGICQYDYVNHDNFIGLCENLEKEGFNENSGLCTKAFFESEYLFIEMKAYILEDTGVCMAYKDGRMILITMQGK